MCQILLFPVVTFSKRMQVLRRFNGARRRRCRRCLRADAAEARQCLADRPHAIFYALEAQT